MTPLIERIQTAESKEALGLLNFEIILQHQDFNANQKAYVKRLEFLEGEEK